MNLDSLESRALLRNVDPNFIKLFQLAQLTVEYLLSVQDAMVEGLSSSRRCRSVQRKLDKCKSRIKEQDSQIEAYRTRCTRNARRCTRTRRSCRTRSPTPR